MLNGKWYTTMPGNCKSQTAMEYLMTYGWVLLVIALAIAVMIGLGVFNSNTFTTKLVPGSCQVQRPYGPGTTKLISTQGECGGGVPQAVASFDNVKYTSSITTNALGMGRDFLSWSPPDVAPETVTAWIYQTTNGVIGGPGSNVMYSTNGVASGFFAINTNGNSEGDFYAGEIGVGTCTLSTPAGTFAKMNGWHFAAVAVNAVDAFFYVNGSLVSSGALSCSSAAGVPSPSSWTTTLGGSFAGYMADVQMYNATLSAAQIKQIYIAGIGGAPTYLPALVGWWPLNGNPDDYGGNGYNGTVVANVVYVDNWQTGYATP